VSAHDPFRGDPSKRAESPWYVRLFGARYVNTYLHRFEPERTRAEVDFLERVLELKPGARVLDAACGHGRHAVELAARGYEVTGVDLDAYSLELAQAAARERGVEGRVQLRQCDLRDMPYVDRFDGAYNYFTSFGYLESEAEDERALHAIACALRPGGRFVLETMNLYKLAKVFRERDDWQTYPNGYAMRADRSWDLATGRLHERRVVRDPQGVEEAVEANLRLYSPSELNKMLYRVGLTVEAALSAPDGAPCTLESHRLAMVARKTG
jgi:SAM-dependent methyltransferase